MTKVGDWCQQVQQSTSGLQNSGSRPWVVGTIPFSQFLKEVGSNPTQKQDQWFVACVDFPSLTKARS